MASPTRWAALGSYIAILVVLFASAAFIVQVPRAPLPRDQIASLVNLVRGESGLLWPRANIQVSAAPGAFRSSEELSSFVKALDAALKGASSRAAAVAAEVESRTVKALRPCASDGASIGVVEGDVVVSEACAEALSGASALDGGDDGRAAGFSGAFELHVAPASDCSALLLSTGLGAVLRWQRGGALQEVTDIAKAVVVELERTWLHASVFERTAMLFEVAPSHVLSFFLVGDCSQRVAWDFHGSVVSPYLRHLLERLRLLFDLDIDAQVVQCGALGDSHARSPEKQAVVNAETLKDGFLRHANDWPGDAVTRDERWLPPLLHLAAFLPSGALKIFDENGLPQHSFAVPGWGALVLANAGDAPCEEAAATEGTEGAARFLSPCEAQRVASGWTAHLRAWLQLPPGGALPSPTDGVLRDGGAFTCNAEAGLLVFAAPPRLSGIADWELRHVAQGVFTLFVRRTAETLEDLVALIDSLPDVVVRAEIGELAFEAAAAAQAAATAAVDGDLATALVGARRALSLALTTSHDDTVVAHLYFSLEFKYAVYLPLGLPILVPVFFSLMRQIMRVAKARKAKRKAFAESLITELS